MKTKLFLLSVMCGLITIFFSFFLSCKKSDKEEPTINRVSIFDNPLDTRITTVESPSGTSMVLHGEKDEEGNPTSINKMEITDEVGETSVMLLNEEGKPAVFYAPNGVKFMLDWLTDGSAAITVIDPTEEWSIHTIVNPQASNNTLASIGDKSSNHRDRQLNTIKFEDLPNHLLSYQLNAQTGTLDESCTLFITRCNMPNDNSLGTGTIGVRMYDYMSDKFIANLTPKFLGNGIYLVTVPASNQPHSSPFLPIVINVVNQYFGKFCAATDMLTGYGVIEGSAICTAISGAIMLSTALFGTPVAAGFYAACEAFMMTTAIACGLHQIVVSDLLSGLADFIDYSYDSYKLVPYQLGMPYDRIGTPIVAAPGDLSSKSMSLDLGGTTRIDDFHLSPSAPGAGVAYQAIADISCIKPGSSVTMSIIGTDGYANTQTSNFPDGVFSQRCTLQVPGAYTGVLDECTITVHSPDGENVTRYASLIFGA